MVLLRVFELPYRLKDDYISKTSVPNINHLELIFASGTKKSVVDEAQDYISISTEP